MYKATAKRLVAIALAVTTIMSLVVPARAFEPNPEHYKYLKMSTLSYKQPITESFYNDKMANLYRPYFTNGDSSLIISFTLQFSQYVDLVLYESLEQYDETLPLAESPYLVEKAITNDLIQTGVDGDGNPLYAEKIGYINGYHFTGNVDLPDGVEPDSLEQVDELHGCQIEREIMELSESGDLPFAPMENEYFYGYEGRRAPQLTFAVTEGDNAIVNHVLWRGEVADENGAPASFAWEDGKTYVVVVEPVLEVNKHYKSLMPFIADTKRAAEGVADMEFPEVIEEFGGDPVSLIDGSMTWDYTDIALYGAQELAFSRHYASKYSDVNRFGMGRGWSHSYAYSLEMQRIFARVYLPDGSNVVFDLGRDGQFYAQPGSMFELTDSAMGFLLKHKDGTEYRFDNDGNIASITTLNGDTTYLTASGGKVTHIENNTGSLTLSYSGGNLSSVTDSAGRTTTYSYSGEFLTSMTNADADTLNYTYNPVGNLLTVKDFNDVTYMENQYDDANRVVAQYMDGQGWFYFSYNPEAGSSTFTDENGQVKTVYYDSHGRIFAVENNYGTESYTYNSLNQLDARTDRLGNTTYYSHDASGNVTAITYPNGTTESYVYNTLNLVTQQTNRDGTVVSYGYDGRGNLTSYTDAKGNVSTFTYDSSNNLLAATDAMGETTSYTYDAKGNCLSQTDALGNATAYVYDTQGRLVLQTNADGSTAEYEYTSAGKLVKTIDPDGNENSYTVSGNGFDTGSVDAMGFSTSTVYNEQNKPVAITDARGNTTTYTYDSVGNLSTTTDTLGGTISYGYDALGRMTSMTDALGFTWSYSYDAEGRMTATTDALGNSTSSSFDNMGRTISSTNKRGATTSYQYDAMGRTTRVTDALGNYSRNVYDANGNLVEQYDKNGNMWTYAYDANNRMISATDPLGFVTTYFYDANGQTTKTVSSLGAQRQTAYDSMGRLITSIDPEGNETGYTYDILGRLVTVTYADGTSSSNTFNANGWLVTATAQDGGVTSYTYNNNGQVLTITDAKGGVTTYVYDALGRTTSVTDALGGAIAYTYDASGNLLTTTDALGNVTAYAYDALNRVTTITDALGNVTSTAYDANGNVSSITNADGGVISYSYDMLDRLTSYTDTEGYTFSFTYDAVGNAVSTTDGRGNTSTTAFDALNRASSATDAEGGVTSVTYDADGRVVATTDAEGAVTGYAYDLNGNIVTLTDALGNVTTFTYDNMNRVVTMTDARGAVTTYTYTAAGYVATITDALGGVVSYEYDLLGNLTKETNELGNSTIYTYDALNRPLTVRNALNKTDTFTYDANGRITSVTDKNGNVTQYFYDANGNVVETKDALNNSSYFEYDSMNRLVEVTLNRKSSGVNENQITLYQYDHRGLVTREINAADQETLYVYDGNGNLIQKTDADGYVTEFAYDARNLVEAINYANDTTTSGSTGNSGSNSGSGSGGGSTSAPATVTSSQSGNNVTITVTDSLGVYTDVVQFAKNSTKIYDVNGYIVEVVYNGSKAKSVKIIGGSNNSGGGQSDQGDPNAPGDEPVIPAAGKEVLFAYNANGELVAMMDWNGVTSFEFDLLGRITSVNDHNDKTTSYTYDAVGNQTSMTYPDGTVINNTYDLLGRLTNVNDAENANTVYAYDAASQLLSTVYPNGWDDAYTYDAVGQLTRQYTRDPSNKANKSVEHTYAYDANGNITSEFRSGSHGMDRFNLSHTYDALNRLTKTTGDQGYKQHTYVYDSLGNLTAETIHNKTDSYTYNNLNQITTKIVEGKDTYNYSYDDRGNLVEVIYAKNTNHSSVTEQYVYDGTNRMVKGINEGGEQSHYIYNGLGYLVGNEWIIAKNAYGYHGVDTAPSQQVDGVVRVCTAHQNTSGQGHQNPTGNGHFADKGQTNNGSSTTGGTTGGTLPTINNKQAVVHKDYVLDYTSALKDVILETEGGAGALTYRYVYGLEKLHVGMTGNLSGSGNLNQNGQVKLWYHHDRLGTKEYLTDNVSGKVTSYVSYDSWGALTSKAIVKMGVRELDLVQEYTGHPYDQVLGLYFAEARMYDATDRRFVAVDWVNGTPSNVQAMVQYTYAANNPLIYVDPWGLYYIRQIVLKYVAQPGPGPDGNSYVDNNTYEYLAVKQSSIAEIAIAAIKAVDPSGGALSGIAIALAQSNAGYVGGNSFQELALLDVKLGMIEYVAGKYAEKFYESIPIKLLGEALPLVDKALAVFEFINTMVSGDMVRAYDEVIFTLFDLIYKDNRNGQIETVISRMNKAYEFVAQNAAYFFGSMTKTIHETNFLGSISYSTQYGKSMWEYDLSMFNAKEKKLGKIRGAYFDELKCFIMSKMPAIIYTQDQIYVNKSWFFDTHIAKNVELFIDDWHQRITNIKHAFRLAVFGSDYASPR